MIKFQYNKTSLQQLDKQLSMRLRTLPTIKSKESALRVEVKHSKDEIARLDIELERQITVYNSMSALWNEFDASLVSVKDVNLNTRKIAGVRVPVLESTEFEVRPYSLFSSPKWYADGIALIQKVAEVGIRREFCKSKLELLEQARKKTTQKVNLFEKVQIPGYEDAIRKIKRFMEDEENLSKSSQKIMRANQARKQKLKEESL
ncbi:V/A-type H+-transporting ATPase subunit D [Dysgonomonadaceae bacterium PH5-43]|nr:V/A-type H+-transporting ATPase subunit D [Dysgonomonadaceae bacterium PH5-43]